MKNLPFVLWMLGWPADFWHLASKMNDVPDDAAKALGVIFLGTWIFVGVLTYQGEPTP